MAKNMVGHHRRSEANKKKQDTKTDHQAEQHQLRQEEVAKPVAPSTVSKPSSFQRQSAIDNHGLPGGHWLLQYRKNNEWNIFSIDVEFVSVPVDPSSVIPIFTTNRNGNVDVTFRSIYNSSASVRYKNVAGTVCVVNHHGKVKYNTKVRHQRGSYLVNKYTRKVNGIEFDDLENGEEIGKVRNKVAGEIDGGLVVGHTLEADLNSLDLDIGLFPHFDIKNQYYGTTKDFQIQGHKLKDIYAAYFKEPFQDGVHSAEADAVATMKIFMEVYMKQVKEGQTSKYAESINHDIVRT